MRLEAGECKGIPGTLPGLLTPVYLNRDIGSPDCNHFLMMKDSEGTAPTAVAPRKINIVLN
jgi:hypothetical protein